MNKLVVILAVVAPACMLQGAADNDVAAWQREAQNVTIIRDTWGQFFIYQGFNDRAGWMHTSSGVDNIDEYLETVFKMGDASSSSAIASAREP